MEENKNSDLNNISNSVENSNARLGLANFQPGSSNSNPRPGSSNSNPQPGPSDSNSHPSTSSNNWLERVRNQQFSRKRPHPENDDSGRDNELNKTEILDGFKNDGNFGNERANENCNDDASGLHDIAIASRELAISSMSTQPKAVAIPQQQMLHQPAVPFQQHSYNPDNHMDPNQGSYGPINFSQMMPCNPQCPVNHILPRAASRDGSTSGMGIPNGIDIVFPTNGYPYMSNSDGSLYSYPPISTQDALVPVFNNLEPIIINHAVLIPPLPGETRARREKPPGCRTVFVGNLPEKITEEIIRDAFKLCGPISVIRMSKKKFCHIRFANMESVEQALLLSGFRIRIDDNEDSESNSKLHVDYASARDDQHDYECQERARLRKERHQQENHRSLMESLSTPPIPEFSDSEYTALADELRKEETFKNALQVLITWLNRGECNKKNNGSFFSLIQNSHNHVKRLRNEKSKLKEAIDKANENLINNNRSVESVVNEIEKVFVAANAQKVWDHFTRSQRKKMEEMKYDTQDLKQTNSEDLIVLREEKEMETSDTEDKISEGFAEMNALREKANNLSEELKTANQTIEVLRLELEESRRNQKNDNVTVNSSEDQVSVNDSATQCSPSRVDASVNEQELIIRVKISSNN